MRIEGLTTTFQNTDRLTDRCESAYMLGSMPAMGKVEVLVLICRTKVSSSR